MRHRFLINLFVFAGGCLLVMIPMFIQSSILHADETARGEPTMGPGIAMFIGLVFAPVGGIVALVVKWILCWAKKRKAELSVSTFPDKV